LSTNNPDSLYWIFAGGSPSTSNDTMPSIKYNSTGLYDVVLLAYNKAGFGINTKPWYIKVIDSIPLADFVASSIQINEGDTVVFTDLSINNPTEWNWKFDGGTPSTSIDRTPEVVYTKAGTYTVSLISSNDAGASTPEV